MRLIKLDLLDGGTIRLNPRHVCWVKSITKNGCSVGVGDVFFEILGDAHTIASKLEKSDTL